MKRFRIACLGVWSKRPAKIERCANISGVRNQQFAVSSSSLVCGAGVFQCLVPQTSAPNAFGTPTATTGPRTMQLAARLVF